MSTPQEHEAGLVAFVAPSKRERTLGFLTSPRHRRKFVDDLWHYRHWDPGAVAELEPGQQRPDFVLSDLVKRGASGEVYLVSATRELDGRTLPLADAVQLVVGFSSGTVISCIPGRLAYFEGESPRDRCVLQAHR